MGCVSEWEIKSAIQIIWWKITRLESNRWNKTIYTNTKYSVSVDGSTFGAERFQRLNNMMSMSFHILNASVHKLSLSLTATFSPLSHRFLKNCTSKKKITPVRYLFWPGLRQSHLSINTHDQILWIQFWYAIVVVVHQIKIAENDICICLHENKPHNHLNYSTVNWQLMPIIMTTSTSSISSS